MGLDMSVYAASRKNQCTDYWDSATYNPETNCYESSITKPHEIASWRKHPSLHGWMEKLYRKKKGDMSNDFNGVELELNRHDIDALEEDIKNEVLPHTEGFFFGSDSAKHYKEYDLKFITEARAQLFLGTRIFYNSSW